MDESLDFSEIREHLKTKKSWKRSALLAIPSIKLNPLSVLLLNKYTKNNRIDVEKLISALLFFLKSVRLEDKLAFLFECYDADSDGYISSTELFDLLKLLNRGILSNSKIQNIVDKTFAEVGEYKMKMDYADFKMLLMSANTNLVELFCCRE